MKTILILLSMTYMLIAQTDINKSVALKWFEKIRNSEYQWVVSQWNKEMYFKLRSRSSTRKTLWNNNPPNPSNPRHNALLHNTGVFQPAVKPSTKPAVKPSTKPAVKPSTKPAVKPSTKPAVKPSIKPAVKPSTKPRVKPSIKPTVIPSVKPFPLAKEPRKTIVLQPSNPWIK